jgi:hypothetical protein
MRESTRIHTEHLAGAEAASEPSARAFPRGFGLFGTLWLTGENGHLQGWPSLLLESGALYLIRTDDPFITNEVLYQLS